MQAVSLLRELGFQSIEHYPGGTAEWSKHRQLSVEQSRSSSAILGPRNHPGSITRVRRGRMQRAMQFVDETSFQAMFGVWLGMVFGCGLLFWLVSLLGFPSLLQQGKALSTSIQGLWTSIYFSFVAATSIGFGDVVPVGLARPIAIVEGAMALLIFGCVISKLVSQRQEHLIEEIHLLTFDERLGRVRTNLHMILSELQLLSNELGQDNMSCSRLLTRLESSAMVFNGDLRTIHGLLYQPQRMLDETMLEGLLANLVAILSEMQRMRAQLHVKDHSSALLEQSFDSIKMLSGEICGECMPQEYTPSLKVWMDRVAALSKQL